MSARVSVLIPTRLTTARVGFLREALAGVAAQTYSSWELIIVDDGSEVSVDAVCQLDSARVRIIRHEQSRGLAAARNVGVQAAAGELVAFLDDDDIWLPNHLQSMVAVFDQHPDVAMVGAATPFYDTDTGAIRPLSHHTVLGYVTLDSVLEEGFSTPSGIMVRKQYFEAIGAFNESFPAYEDQDLLFRMLERFPCYFLNEVVGYYRLHSSNMTRNELPMALNSIKMLEAFLARHPTYRRHPRIPPRLARQHYRAAKAYASDGRWNQAARHLQLSLRLWPKVGRRFFNPTDSGLQKCLKLVKPYCALIGLLMLASPLGRVAKALSKTKQGRMPPPLPDQVASERG